MTENPDSTDQAANTDEQHGDTTQRDQLSGPQRTETNLTDDLRKIAADAAYAATGFATFLGDKAKDFYDDQRRQYAATHPDAEKDPGAKEFLAQLNERLNAFVEDLTRSFRDMSERGRRSLNKTTDDVAPGETTAEYPTTESGQENPGGDDQARPADGEPL